MWSDIAVRYVQSKQVLFCKAGMHEACILLASKMQTTEPRPAIYVENEFNKEDVLGSLQNLWRIRRQEEAFLELSGSHGAHTWLAP